MNKQTKKELRIAASRRADAIIASVQQKKQWVIAKCMGYNPNRPERAYHFMIAADDSRLSSPQWTVIAKIAVMRHDWQRNMGSGHAFRTYQTETGGLWDVYADHSAVKRIIMQTPDGRF